MVIVVLSGNHFIAEEEALYPPFSGSVYNKIAMQARRRSTVVSSSNGFLNFCQSGTGHFEKIIQSLKSQFSFLDVK